MAKQLKPQHQIREQEQRSFDSIKSARMRALLKKITGRPMRQRNQKGNQNG